MNDATLRVLIDETIARALERQRGVSFMPATVLDGADPMAVLVQVDGDSAAPLEEQPSDGVSVQSLIGALAPSTRVMLAFYPPAGCVIIGVIGECGAIVTVTAATTPLQIAELSRSLYDACGGCEIIMQPGVYNFAGASGIMSDLADRTYIHGSPGVIWLWGNTPDYPMLVDGVEDAAVAFTSNQAANSYTLSLPVGQGANFAVDDVIGCRSLAVVAGTAGVSVTGAPREIFRVLGVVGDVVTIDQPTRFAYLTANFAEFFKQTPKKDIIIDGVTITWDPNEPVKWRGPLFSKALRCHMRNINVVNGPGVTFDDAIHCTVNDITVDGSKEYNTAYLTGSYGVTISGAGHGAIVDGGTFRAVRHSVTTLFTLINTVNYCGPYDTEFANLVVWGGPESFAGVDNHQLAHDTSYNNIKVFGPGQDATPAYQDRAIRSRYTNIQGRGSNRIITVTIDAADCTIDGIDCQDVTIGTSPQAVLLSGPRPRLLRGRFRNCSTAVVVGNTATDALIEMCEFKSGTIAIQDSSSSDIGQIARNNVFRLGTNEYAIGYNGWRGHEIDSKFLGTVGSPFFTVTNARVSKAFDPPVVVTYAATITATPFILNNLYVTLTGNVTFANPATAHKVRGNRCRFHTVQDGTGGRTHTWGGDFNVLTAAVTTANLHNIWDFEYDGTQWVEVNANVGV